MYPRMAISGKNVRKWERSTFIQGAVTRVRKCERQATGPLKLWDRKFLKQHLFSTTRMSGRSIGPKKEARNNRKGFAIFPMLKNSRRPKMGHDTLHSFCIHGSTPHGTAWCA